MPTTPPAVMHLPVDADRAVRVTTAEPAEGMPNFMVQSVAGTLANILTALLIYAWGSALGFIHGAPTMHIEPKVFALILSATLCVAGVVLGIHATRQQARRLAAVAAIRQEFLDDRAATLQTLDSLDTMQDKLALVQEDLAAAQERVHHDRAELVSTRVELARVMEEASRLRQQVNAAARRHRWPRRGA